MWSARIAVILKREKPFTAAINVARSSVNLATFAAGS